MAWWPRKDADQEEDNIKYMLFSATFTKAAHGLATTQLADHHVRLRVGCARSTHSNIKQDTIWAEPYLKKQACLDLLNTVPPGRTIISINNNKQDAIWAEPYLKKQACLDLLNTVPPGRTIIFVNNKHAADELDDFLFNKRVPGTYSVFTINRRRNSSYRFSRNGLVRSRVVLVELKQKFRRSNNGEVRGPVRFGRKD
uniref:Uncharacterized protein B22L22.090 n=1 Tax=Neurospora crassa TaxID=5141 RepID=F5HEK9_NEUCS|nr:conserved hypothetical protein [Neurospora crassa]